MGCACVEFVKGPRMDTRCMCGHRYGNHSNGVYGPCLGCSCGAWQDVSTPSAPDPTRGAPVRILRLLEYTYPDLAAAEEDMARWSAPANGVVAFRPTAPRRKIRSTIIGPTASPEAPTITFGSFDRPEEEKPDDPHA